MNDIQSHKDLKVWQESMILVEEVYRLTSNFPKEELFGLVSQMRRASISIPSNIAEGAGRKSKKEFIHFLYIALGSLNEIETQLEISKRLNYISNLDDFDTQFLHIKRMLLKLIESLKRDIEEG
ncbi:four helix bundle protein [Empedobacter falsenii]